MIRQDQTSKMMIVLAMALSVYLATFETTTLILFPALLLTFGIVMEFFLERKTEDISNTRDKGSWKEIGFYSILALFGLFITGFAVKTFTLGITLSGFSSIAYGVLMAIAEEQFFRGFITDLFLSRIKQSFVAIFLAGATFAVYHIARYAVEPEAMIYVLAGGVILSWVAYRSRRLSPGMVAHVINNLRAAFGV